jgi:amidase
MVDTSLTRTSACELVRLIRARSVSPLEVVEAHLDAITRLNPRLNAVVTVAAEQAQRAARLAGSAARIRRRLGILEGLPVAIKDTTATAGIRTTFGSPLFERHVPDEDAEVVRRLKNAGAIIIAKTNTPEFGCGAFTNNALFGPTRNPWNPALSPGGSSGGSAAAVAAGMVPLAQGTDFACSIRVPAAFCGIVGLRPTPGLIPGSSGTLGWDHAQVQGALARDARDVALMLDAMVGFSDLSPISVAPPWLSALAEMDRSGDADGLRIAYAADIAGTGVDAEIERVCRAAAYRLRDAGAQVEEVVFDLADGGEAYLAWRGLWMVSQQHARLSMRARFGRHLRSDIEGGLRLTATDIAAAESKRTEIFRRFRRLFERFDVLLTPASITQPFAADADGPADRSVGEDHMAWVASSFLVTFAGLPAASAPAGFAPHGMPVGMQIVGRRFTEPLLLRLADIIRRRSGVGWSSDAVPLAVPAVDEVGR